MRTSTSIPRIDAHHRGLIHEELTEQIIGAFYEVHNELGHGFLESVYEQALAVAFAEGRVDPCEPAEMKLLNAETKLSKD